MIAQVIEMTLKPGNAGAATKFLEQKKANVMGRGGSPRQVSIIENRNLRTVLVVAVFDDEQALRSFTASSEAVALLDHLKTLSAAPVKTYEALYTTP
jgi:uncharacterized protein (DUF1330 family)